MDSTTDHDPDTGTGSQVLPAPGSPAHVRQLAQLQLRAGTPPADDITPVGAVEIAARLGVPRPTVDKWRERGVLPDPDWTVGGRPAWKWGTIRAWAERSGRLQQPGST